MRKILLALVMTTLLVGIAQGQKPVPDSLMTDIGKITDKTIDRICEGLGTFADNAGMAMETAWPFAMKYVIMKEVTPAIILIVLVFFPIVVFVWAFRRAKIHYNPKENFGYQNQAFDNWIPTMVISGIVVLVMMVFVGISSYYAALAIVCPEAVTIEYLTRLI